MIDFDILFILFSLAIIAVVVINVWGWVNMWERRKSKKKLTVRPLRKLARVPLLQKIVRWQLRHKQLLASLFLVLVAIGLAYSGFAPEPRIVYEQSYPAVEGNWDDYYRPIEVTFNVPVDIESLRPFISRDEVEGEWVYEKYLGFLPVTRRAKFYPVASVLPDQRIVLYMTGVRRKGISEAHEHALNFFSRKPAQVFSTSPANDAEEVDTHSAIEFTFDKDITPSEQWSFQITPEIQYEQTFSASNKILLTPTSPLNQSQMYVVEVVRTPTTFKLADGEVTFRDNPETIHELTFSTVKAPLVKRFSPTGSGIRETAEIEVLFEVDMDKSSVETTLQLTPDFPHTLVWNSERSLTIIPTSPLAKETEYSFVLPPGIQSTTGGISDREVRYTFTTIGAVRVTSFAPTNGVNRVPRNIQIRVAFDQEVDHLSAQSLFSVSPALPGTFAWEGNTLIYTPSQLTAFQTLYTVTVAAGVKTVHGLDSREAFSSTFTTVPNQTLVPGMSAALFDKQDYNMTCAVAASKMALAWKGIYRSEETLIAQMGREPDQYLYDGSIGAYRWGNPNEGFVGTIAGGGGTDPNRAYGVHWEPIRRMYQNVYGIHSEVRSGWNVVGLAQEIAAGHPVQVWGWNGYSVTWGGTGGARMDWYTAEGTQVYAINGMHSWLIVGFNGDVTNPTSFIYLDPWRGYITFDVNFFKQQWSYFNNTGLIMY